LWRAFATGAAPVHAMAISMRILQLATTETWHTIG